MRIKIRLHGKENLKAFDKLLNKLASDTWEDEAHRGLIDAGRKVRSRVAKTAAKQGAFKNYGEVVPYMRSTDDGGVLKYRIFAVRDGQPLDVYKGLKVLAQKGRAASSRQKGRAIEDRGGVLSGVWNNARIFKRSFATERGQFAVLPAGEKGKRFSARGSSLPPALWTYGRKDGQPRDAKGQFAPSSDRTKAGKVRRLCGPSLRFEIVQGEALETFAREAPVQTKIIVEKRLSKIMKI